ncbi:peptidase domain-containing ABC transporter [Enterobacter asburiae]|uniref:peptidase domain-containing ABC transporter n=1 Tax=Enterobacter asburiae TaxID=61645 RepID=UPI002075F161|nr:peptidase domain-containing ABC transporter [Enterobacter asburiae]MCM7773452.1 peptidase domain-containing ABC transporter [Enterobacter asburiae]
MSFLQRLQFGWRRRLPVVQQSQAAECGLACVNMVANYYGHHIDMVTMRQRFSSSLKGATLADVMLVAHRMGLAGRALRLDLHELGQLRRPCILHWSLNHFVVLKRVTRKGIVIHDPARGEWEVPMEEVSRCFTGVALELLPGANFKKQEEKQRISMTRLIGSVQGAFPTFVQILALSVALELFGVLTPFYMQWVMDQVLVSADWDLLSMLGIGFIMVVLMQNVISALRSWVMAWFSSLLGVQWTVNVCAHLLRLPMSYFETRHIGDVISRFGSIETIQSTLTNRFISTVLDGVMAIVTLCMLFIYNSTLSWLTIGLFLAYVVVRLVSYRPFRQANEDHIITAARAQTILLESVRGVQALKINNKQELRVTAYANALVDTTNKGVAIQRLSIGFSTLQGVISGVGRVVLIWLAARQVLEGNFSAGMLVAFISFSDQFISRASGLIDAAIDFRMLRLHGERLADIVLTEAEKDSDTGLVAVSYRREDAPSVLSVEGLSFRYAETDPWVLEEASFSVAAGESVAIVGPSGQGKTTLVKLLLGLIEPEAGCVTLDGFDIRQVGLQRYRARIGCVMQDDILFAGSLNDNISFFDPEVDLVAVERAARVAQIHDDIMAMPMGYQSLVGDMGSSLSGGQVQRVLLARALYRNPSILILDEASSHLDVERERLINDAVKTMPITRIIIAHRPETIASADRVLLVNNGKVEPWQLPLLTE